ncbi:MAG: ABC transporter substrate-binding protein [Halarcobacter sp.]
MFKIFISIFLLFTSLSFAMTKDEIKIEMTNKIDKVLIILKDSNLSKDQKGEEIISIMDDVFDYNLMSRLSLGNKWKEISIDQKKEFITLFTKKLKDSYIEKLDLYTDELVKIVGIEQTKKTRIKLKTQLVGKDATHDIFYKFYKMRNEDNWLIYDVDVIGVSIIQAYRKQFSGFLNDKSFNELLVHLKNPNKK